MPLQATSGAASYDGFGGGVAAIPNYIEDVFSTYLYKGNSLTQTITNNIDLSTKGGLVWIKSRDTTFDHMLFDTTRGASKYLNSNATTAESTNIYQLSSFNTNGFSLGDGNFTNNSTYNYASWTFREQPKFFDVVTYTGNGGTLAVSHALTSTPGCVFVKRTNSSSDWVVGHRGSSGSYWASQTLRLNTTAGGVINGEFAAMSDTTVTVVNSGGSYGDVNTNGATYVMYLFAHNAGGFGLTGTDNVISCGSVVGASQVEVNLGYEPQWILVKNASSAQDWWLVDNMRGLPVQDTSSAYNASNLRPNLSDAETTGFSIAPSATGFKANVLTASQTYIYIAIRRGPMKVPTTGTSVFKPVTYTGISGNQSITGVGFPPDLFMANWRANTKGNFEDRLRGTAPYLQSTETAAEASFASTIVSYDMSGITLGVNNLNNKDGASFVGYFYQRAPSFMDVVCYTGTGSARTVSHNLAAVPELMIVKSRDLAQGGAVYTASTGNANYLRLFSTSSDSGETATSFWNSTTPTASVFSLGTANNVNGNTNTYVAYLFATCAGVSKVGSYTGTGATQTINCGFTGGARFVLIKKSTSTAPDRDWYVWDTARGMTAGTDPSFKINTTAPEVNANDVYTITTGFQLVSSSDYVNASGVTYIFLAIA